MEKAKSVAPRYIHAVILCSAPGARSRAEADWRWAPGWPIHPINPFVVARRFPLDVTLAFYIRFHRSREALLSVTVVDEASRALAWGDGKLEPATLDVSVPRADTEWPAEEGYYVILPCVQFASAGRFSALTRVETRAGLELDAVATTIEVAALREPVEIASGARRTVRLAAVETELPAPLGPQGTRVLRLAAAEARRLGHGHVGTEHIVIALRRVLGSRSGLPSTNLLREAVEQIDGMYASPPPRMQMGVTPAAMRLLHDAAARAPAGANASDLLAALPDSGGSHITIVEEATLLAKRRPR